MDVNPIPSLTLPATVSRATAPPGCDCGGSGCDSCRPTEGQTREVQKLKARDAEVRAHEAAHLAAAGGLARGGAAYTYTTGPDGKRYASGGEVSIDTSPEATPEATLRKAAQIRRAALAPASPSATDRAVAQQAAAMAAQARVEIAQERNSGANRDDLDPVSASYRSSDAPLAPSVLPNSSPDRPSPAPRAKTRAIRPDRVTLGGRSTWRNRGH